MLVGASDVMTARSSKPPTPTRVATNNTALYLRVSTEDQDLAGQERELCGYAASHQWEVVSVYAEKASATGKVEREVYHEVLEAARKPNRLRDHLLVWSLDRWSREERFSRAVLAIEDLEAKGVRFHSFKEPMIDSSEDGGPNMGRDILRAILPVIAAFESRRRAERVRVAMRELKEGYRTTRSGRPVGRPRRLTVDKARKILELRTSGECWAVVAQLVALPIATCRRARTILSNGSVIATPSSPTGGSATVPP